jgi:hypothetical protein
MAMKGADFVIGYATVRIDCVAWSKVYQMEMGKMAHGQVTME